MRKLVHFVAPIVGVIYLPILFTAVALLFSAVLVSLLALPPYLILVQLMGVGIWKSVFISLGAYIAMWIIGVISFFNLDENNVGWFMAATGKMEAWHRGLLVERPRTPNRRELAENYAVD